MRSPTRITLIRHSPEWPKKLLILEALNINQRDQITLTDPSGKEKMNVKVTCAFVGEDGLVAYVSKEPTFLERWGAILVTTIFCGLISIPTFLNVNVPSGLLVWLAPPAILTLVFTLSHHLDMRRWSIVREFAKKTLSEMLAHEIEGGKDAV